MCEWRHQHQSGDSSIREETVLIAVSLTLSRTPLLSRCLTLTLSHSLAVSTHTLLSPLSSLLLMSPLSFACCCLTLMLRSPLSFSCWCCLHSHAAVSRHILLSPLPTLMLMSPLSTLHSQAAVLTLMLRSALSCYISAFHLH